MTPYYYVRRINGHEPAVRHDTLEKAQAEAERLATKHAGAAFEILMCLGIAQTAQVKTFWMDGVEIAKL